MTVVWLTGRPASGKTTLARRLVAALTEASIPATLVDSDEVRAVLTPTPRYDDDERALVYRAIAYLARRLADEGVVPVVAATAHDAHLRSIARAIAPDLVLVHVDCPLAVCEARDPKGLYARARRSAEGHLPGVHVPYEVPDDATFTVNGALPLEGAVVSSLVDQIRQGLRAEAQGLRQPHAWRA